MHAKMLVIVLQFAEIQQRFMIKKSDNRTIEIQTPDEQWPMGESLKADSAVNVAPRSRLEIKTKERLVKIT